MIHEMTNLRNMILLKGMVLLDQFSCPEQGPVKRGLIWCCQFLARKKCVEFNLTEITPWCQEFDTSILLFYIIDVFWIKIKS